MFDVVAQIRQDALLAIDGLQLVVQSPQRSTNIASGMHDDGAHGPNRAQLRPRAAFSARRSGLSSTRSNLAQREIPRERPRSRLLLPRTSRSLRRFEG